MSKWRKLRRLPWTEWRLLLQAVFLLPLVAALVRLGGLRRCMVALARFAPDEYAETVVPAEQTVRSVARMVRAAALHGPYRANCLQQSVTLWWLLRRRGVASDLRIGTRKDAQGLEAHAWVEVGGRALNENPDVHTHYQPFDQPINLAGARYR